MVYITPMERIGKDLVKLHIHLPFDPIIILLGIQPKHILPKLQKRYMHKVTNCSTNHNSKGRKQPKCHNQGLIKKNTIHPYDIVLYNYNKE